VVAPFSALAFVGYVCVSLSFRFLLYVCVCAGAAACGPLSDRCLDRAVMSAVALGLLACLLTFWLPVAHSASLGLVLGLAGTAITIPKVSLPLLARSELLPLQFMGTTGAVVDVVAEFGKETRLFAPFLYKIIILPRQARDKHRESTQKRTRFCRQNLHKRLGGRALRAKGPWWGGVQRLRRSVAGRPPQATGGLPWRHDAVSENVFLIPAFCVYK
jgi:hypothetical protein